MKYYFFGLAIIAAADADKFGAFVFVVVAWCFATIDYCKEKR